MPVVLLAVALAVLVWAVIVTRRISVLAVVVATVLLGYVFGYEFWHVRFGPLPITIDRLLLVLVIAIIVFRGWQGKIHWRGPSLIDWALGGTLLWLTLSAVIHNLGVNPNSPTSPYFRLLFSFWLPALLYFAVRQAPISTQATTKIFAALAVLGCYLAFTACAETTQQWWAVFPRYLSNPELGAHFGRARGPALNSVSLGTYLCITFWAAWMLRSRVARGWQLVLLAGLGLMVFAVLLTYTRSVWIGLAASGFLMLIAQSPPRLRWPVAGTAAVLGLVVAAVGWSSLLNLSREDSGAVSHHSVQQRTAFAYVSYQMFCDQPLWGVGFGRFYDKKLPYLSDRSQSFELDSLRELHHHNTFLSLLTETGMIGLAGYMAVLVGWVRTGWQMAFSSDTPLASRQMGQLLLATLAVYLPSALFHDVSLIFQDQWLLFVVAGIAVATAEQTAVSTSSVRERSHSAVTPILASTNGTSFA